MGADPGHFDFPIVDAHLEVLEPMRRLTREWVFPAPESASGHLECPSRLAWSSQPTPHPPDALLKRLERFEGSGHRNPLLVVETIVLFARVTLWDKSPIFSRLKNEA
jgi:hypothetical protein